MVAFNPAVATRIAGPDSPINRCVHLPQAIAKADMDMGCDTHFSRTDISLLNRHKAVGNVPK
eukprot:792503-Amphidinium_carterae.1